MVATSRHAGSRAACAHLPSRGLLPSVRAASTLLLLSHEVTMSNTIDDCIRSWNQRAAATPPRRAIAPPPARPAPPPEVSVTIAALNARLAQSAPRPRPAPAPVGPSRLDQAAAERSPAVQATRQFNARAAADLAKQQAKRSADRECEQANARARAQILGSLAAEAEHEQRIQAAIRELAEAHIRGQERTKQCAP
jgi:hypothetical protein